mgnify:CR=1 FL=1
MSSSFLLIGHRTSGKSTLGRRLAEYHSVPFIDLDEAIAARHGKSAAELVAKDEAAFRKIEVEELTRISEQSAPAVIAAGGGLQSFPQNMFVLWITRDGWEETALAERDRLRPELNADEEIAWMIETREPRFQRAAHLQLQIERGCSIDEAARRLQLLSDWLLAAVDSPGMRMSWMVPRDADDLAHCAATASLFGMAGVEIRSDVFPEIPDLDVPYLASLRTEDPGFFQRSKNAAAFDCDTALLQHMDLSGLEPRPLILSTHPNDVFKEYFDHLINLPAWIEKALPAWSDHVMLKYAPRVKSWTEMRYANQLYKVFEKSGGRLSFLPQGKPWRWMRAMRLVSGNQTNYISTGCKEISHRPPSVDYFLPHVQMPAPSEFHGIIGNPVDHSHGDVFHRAMSLAAEDGKSSYLKIPLSKQEIDNCLHLLPQLGFRGLSVTSPLKENILESNFVGCETDLPAGNTLAYIKGSFLLYDTDEAGMRAALSEIARAGIEPGPTAIFGSGGVSHALQRALEAEGWMPVTVVSARSGWGPHADNGYSLVVDASGGESAAINAPHARAWLSLSYQKIARAPGSAESFFNGMTFFKKQALAQRELWDLATPEEHDLL